MTNLVKNSASLAMTWTPISLTGRWYSVAYGKGTYVAVASDGKIATSTNGQNWTVRNLEGNWGNITYQYQPECFIITGSNGATARSVDGFTWTRTIPNRTEYLSTAIYAKNQYVAVGENIYATSNDGLNWNYGTMPPIARTLLYEEDREIYFSTGYEVSLYSSDGRNWQSQFLEGNYYGMAYGRGKFVSVGDHCSATSSDGITWNFHPVSLFFEDVTHDQDKFIGVGMYFISYSTDGINWQDNQEINLRLNGITYNINKKEYVAVGKDIIYYSNGQ